MFHRDGTLLARHITPMGRFDRAKTSNGSLISKVLNEAAIRPCVCAVRLHDQDPARFGSELSRFPIVGRRHHDWSRQRWPTGVRKPSS